MRIKRYRKLLECEQCLSKITMRMKVKMEESFRSKRKTFDKMGSCSVFLSKHDNEVEAHSKITLSKSRKAFTPDFITQVRD